MRTLRRAVAVRIALIVDEPVSYETPVPPNPGQISASCVGVDAQRTHLRYAEVGQDGWVSNRFQSFRFTADPSW